MKELMELSSVSFNELKIYTCDDAVFAFSYLALHALNVYLA
jgi:hypothetical protein